MNVVKKLYTDGRVEEVKERMTLEQMQKFVGGFILNNAARLPRTAL